MTREQISEYINTYKWKWTLAPVCNKDHVFTCWRLKGYGNGSEIYLVQDFDEQMNTKGALSITSDEGKTIIRRFSCKMEAQLISIANRLLKNRKRAQARYAKRGK